MILSDKSIREALHEGRIIIDPLDESCIQPSSIDVKVSNLFRVFRNHTSAVIDVKKDLVIVNAGLKSEGMIPIDQFIGFDGKVEVKEGDTITIDGSTGRIILGEVQTVKPEVSGNFYKLMSWADNYRKLKVQRTEYEEHPKFLHHCPY